MRRRLFILVLKFTAPATAPENTEPVEAPILPQWLTAAAAQPTTPAPSKG